MRTATPFGVTLVAAALALGAHAASPGAPVATPVATTAAAVTTSVPQAAPRDASRPRLLALPPPRAFERHVTNPYFPLHPGTRWVYRGFGSEAGQREVVRVLHRTRRIEGIRATVVRDRATEDGRLIELTYDWYAQDRRGRVWYLGEATTSYDEGQTSTKGSWQAGVDGARAGVVMFRRGRLNVPYWQEYFAGEAEDQGVLLDRQARVALRSGDYRRLRLTKDITPLEPEIMELKFYARGVGLVLELGTSPELGRVALVKMSRPGR